MYLACTHTEPAYSHNTTHTHTLFVGRAESIVKFWKVRYDPIALSLVVLLFLLLLLVVVLKRNETTKQASNEEFCYTYRYAYICLYRLYFHSCKQVNTNKNKNINSLKNLKTHTHTQKLNIRSNTIRLNVVGVVQTSFVSRASPNSAFGFLCGLRFLFFSFVLSCSLARIYVCTNIYIYGNLANNINI